MEHLCLLQLEKALATLVATIQVGKKIKDKKERFFLDPRVTNVQRLHPEGINKKA
jgi:hypothetical protein